MSERFYLPQPPRENEPAVLVESEAHHLAHVVRAKVGQCVELFDGQGNEFTGRILAVRRNEVTLELVSRRQVDRESPRPLTLAVALPKGERQKWLVEKATELGVALLVPLVTERGVAEAGSGALGRLRRTVIEASKQCCRNRLMTIAEPCSVAQLAGEAAPAALRLVAHPAPAEAPLANLLAPLASAAPVVAAVGPEGGFTELELETFRAAAWHTLALGERVLRIETAGLALAARLLVP